MQVEQKKLHTVWYEIFAVQEMGRKASRGCLFCADRSEAETLNLGSRDAPLRKKGSIPSGMKPFFLCRRWDLNPHEVTLVRF